PGKGSGGRLAELQVEENPLAQPSITAFQMGGMDAAFEQFEKWVFGKEKPHLPPAEPPPPEPLPPLWAASLESERFPGFFLGAEGAQAGEVLASSTATEVLDGDGHRNYSLWLREYAHGIVSMESAHSSGLFVTAFGEDIEYREVRLAAPRPGGEAAGYFRLRAAGGGLVTFESVCFPGFFLNVYGSGATRKYVQLVPEEPTDPQSHAWGFFRMARAPLPAQPVPPPPEPAAGGQGSRSLDDEDQRANIVGSTGVGKRMSISPIRSIMRSVQGVQSGVQSVRRMGAVASLRAATPVNSTVGRRGRSPGSRRRE
ncbi:unnamed protein product, partial [Prorocentrum cordatum]